MLTSINLKKFHQSSCRVQIINKLQLVLPKTRYNSSYKAKTELITSGDRELELPTNSFSNTETLSNLLLKSATVDSKVKSKSYEQHQCTYYDLIPKIIVSNKSLESHLPTSSFSLITCSTLSTTCLTENASFSIESNKNKWDFTFSDRTPSFLSLIWIERFISQVDSYTRNIFYLYSKIMQNQIKLYAIYYIIH